MPAARSAIFRSASLTLFAALHCSLVLGVAPAPAQGSLRTDVDVFKDGRPTREHYSSEIKHSQDRADYLALLDRQSEPLRSGFSEEVLVGELSWQRLYGEYDFFLSPRVEDISTYRVHLRERQGRKGYKQSTDWLFARVELTPLARKELSSASILVPPYVKDSVLVMLPRVDVDFLEDLGVGLERLSTYGLGSPPSVTEAGGDLIWSEGFETAFPGSEYTVGDSNAASGEDFWDDVSCQSLEGSESIWSADVGGFFTCSSYDDDMNAYVYPSDGVDVGGFEDVTFYYSIWYDTELDFDTLERWSSSDGVSWTVRIVFTGNSGGWNSRFTNLSGFQTYYWRFEFVSDFSLSDYEGAYVDALEFRGNPAQADLDLFFLDAPNGTFQPGDVLQVHNQTENIGGVSSASYSITFYASTNEIISSSDYELATYSRESLAPGEIANRLSDAPLPIDLPDDDYYVGAILNVVDANSANNTRHDAVPITVESPCTPPAQPGNPNPAIGEVLDDQPALLDWSTASGATSYNVFVDGLFSGTVFTSQWTPNLTLSADSHSWHVEAVNSCGTTVGPPWDFWVSLELSNGVSVPDSLSGVGIQSAWKYYYFDLGTDIDELVVDLSGLTGDADLYVRFESPPDLGSWSCRPFSSGTTSEQCFFPSPSSGRWWIGVNNFDVGLLNYDVEASWSIGEPDIRVEPLELTFVEASSIGATDVHSQARTELPRLRLKRRDIRVDEIESLDFNSSGYLLLWIEPAEWAVSLARLRQAGVRILAPIPTSGLFVEVTGGAALTDISGVRWIGRLKPEDKLSSNLDHEGDTAAIVDFFEGTSRNEMLIVLDRFGIEPIENGSLKQASIGVVGSLDELTLLAAEPEIAWIQKAPPSLANGDSFYHCPGAMSEFGYVPEFVVHDDGWDGPGLGSAALTYRFVNGTPDVSGNTEEGEVERALREWARVAAVTWTETQAGGGSQSVEISWVSGDHGDGSPFDGPGGTLAHAFYPAPPNPEPIGGDMHFDEDEFWEIGTGHDVFSVGLHEAGHSLGLDHSEDPDAVMDPFIISGEIFDGLDQDDIDGILSIYLPAASQTFTIFNDGSRVLNITDMSLDSPGSWINWSPDTPIDIDVGDTTEVTVSVDFDSAPAGQTTSRRLLVYSDDPDESPYPGGVDVVVDTLESHTLSVALSGGGSGSVTSSPSGINCPGDCSEDYSEGTAVRLSPVADPGSIFVAWSGDADCADGTVTMTVPASCTAEFQIESHVLSISLTGSGSGSVTSSPLGIDCPGDCSDDYTAGTIVSLSAVADSGSLFVAWSGDPDCADGTVTMTAPTNCTAEFQIESHVLSISLTGSGSGSVTSSPSGINCPDDCAEDYSEGTVVSLSPIAHPGSVFVAWSGDADCADGTVTMTAPTDCTAEFQIESHSLSVALSGGGSGSVTSSPSGINCPGDCSEDYSQGTVVRLSPVADPGSIFVAWSGDADCADGTVTMTVPASCTAEFQIESHALSVSLSGSGSGSVTSSPPGIDCPGDCSEDYTQGTVVSLSPIADPGSVFVAWSGDADCADGTVTMNAPTSCTAEFQIESHLLSISLTGSGSGSVTSSPLGIDCPGDCSEGYTAGTIVSLSAIADPGSLFVAWSGDADCADGSVTVNAPTSCTAEFQIDGQQLVANFTVDDPQGIAPFTAAFQDLSEGNPSQWLWSFGDGTTSNEQNPVHTFARSGTYTVRLEVFDGVDSSALAQPGLMQITANELRDLPSTIVLDVSPGQETAEVLRLLGESSSGELGWRVATGDLDGDSVADALVSAPEASAPGGSEAGRTYIVYGAASLADVIQLDLANPTVPITTVLGDDADDLLGQALAVADVNGDGVDDAVITAHQGDPFGRTRAGEAYVIYGHAGLRSLSEIDLNVSPGAESTTVTRILGPSSFDWFGWSAAAEDLNGDGYADIAIGSVIADEVHVLFGESSISSLVGVDLADDLETLPIHVVLLDAAGTDFGQSVSIGDANGDGINELAIGSPEFDLDNLTNSGEIILVYGGQGWDLANFVDFDVPPGSEPLPVTRVYGGDDSDKAGESLAFGDINGDGYSDLIVGSEPGVHHPAGEVYVVFGSANLASTEIIDLRVAPGLETATVTRIYGEANGDDFGLSVGSGDINGDRFTDILIGADSAEPLGGTLVGVTYVLYGGEQIEQFPELDLANLAPEVQVSEVVGAETGDHVGTSVGSGDLNGDGIWDLLTGAYWADPFGRNQAGEVYFVMGGLIGRSLYEDAEDGLIDGWSRVGAHQGLVENVVDPLQGRVIEVVSTSDDDVFMLLTGSGQAFNNFTQHFARWDSASTLEYQVAWGVTSVLDRYDMIVYRSGPGNGCIVAPNPRVIACQEPALAADGTWRTIGRSLAEDLSSVDPTDGIESVDELFVRGTARIDNVELLAMEP